MLDASLEMVHRPIYSVPINVLYTAFKFQELPSCR